MLSNKCLQVIEREREREREGKAAALKDGKKKREKEGELSGPGYRNKCPMNEKKEEEEERRRSTREKGQVGGRIRLSQVLLLIPLFFVQLHQTGCYWFTGACTFTLIGE